MYYGIVQEERDAAAKGISPERMQQIKDEIREEERIKTLTRDTPDGVS